MKKAKTKQNNTKRTKKTVKTTNDSPPPPKQGSITYQNVKLTIAGGTITFRVRLTKYSSVGTDFLVHLSLEEPKDKNTTTEDKIATAGELDWTRVVSYYEAAYVQTAKDKKLDPVQESGILRCLALGLISIAHPLQYSALLCKIISKKTFAAADAEKKKVKKTIPLHGNQKPGIDEPEYDVDVMMRLIEDQRRRATDPQLHDTAKGTLTAVLLPPDVLNNYYPFEDQVLSKWREINQQQTDRSVQLQEIGKHIKNLVKNADDTTRQNLAVLRLACDTARHEMYQWVMGQIIQEPPIKAQLDPGSLQYNLIAHAVQDKLGGMVPALHPFWNLLLKTPGFVSLMVKHVADPNSQQNIETINSAITHAISAYVRLVTLEEESSDSDADSLQDENFRHQLADDGTLADEEAFRNALIPSLTEGKKDDEDIQVVLERIVDGMSEQEIARRHKHTVSWVSKSLKAGKKKLHYQALRLGITPDALLSFQSVKSHGATEEDDRSDVEQVFTSKWKN